MQPQGANELLMGHFIGDCTSEHGIGWARAYIVQLAVMEIPNVLMIMTICSLVVLGACATHVQVLFNHFSEHQTSDDRLDKETFFKSLGAGEIIHRLLRTCFCYL